MTLALLLSRFIQYVLLLPLLGICLAPFYLPDLTLPRRALRTLAIGGLLASLAALASLILAMAGDLSSALQPTIAEAVLLETPAGISSLVRIALLIALAGAAARAPARLLAVLAAVSVASLAFTGHANAGTGLFWPLRLLADMLHLAAAATWIGALLVFIAMARRGGPLLAPSLARFSGIGSLAVAVLVASGLFNLAADQNWTLHRPGVWLELLIVKLCLFAAMLLLAGLNRWRLAPALAAGGGEAPLRHLRLSLGVETTLAGGVLVLVAALGTLDPLH